MNIDEYNRLTKNKKCSFCGGDLGTIRNFDHVSGWEVDGYQSKQWLYRPCLKCGHEWAIQYLGVPRIFKKPSPKGMGDSITQSQIKGELEYCCRCGVIKQPNRKICVNCGADCTECD